MLLNTEFPYGKLYLYVQKWNKKIQCNNMIQDKLSNSHEVHLKNNGLMCLQIQSY